MNARYRRVFNVCVFIALLAVLGPVWLDLAIFLGLKSRPRPAAAPAPPAAVLASPANAGSTNQIVPPVPDFQVQGLMGTARRRRVIVNGRQFEQGAEHTLEVKGREVRVRCVEIGEKTASLIAAGTNVTLTLKEE